MIWVNHREKQHQFPKISILILLISSKILLSRWKMINNISYIKHSKCWIVLIHCQAISICLHHSPNVNMRVNHIKNRSVQQFTDFQHHLKIHMKQINVTNLIQNIRDHYAFWTSYVGSTWKFCFWIERWWTSVWNVNLSNSTVLTLKTILLWIPKMHLPHCQFFISTTSHSNKKCTLLLCS